MSINVDDKSWRQLIDLHALYRLRVVNEDCLIHNRLSWFLTSEVALFVLWSAVLSEAISLPLLIKVLLIMLIGASGFVIGVASLFAISAAYKEIERLTALYSRDVLPLFVGVAVPLPGLKGDEPLHWHGKLYTIVLPIAAMIAWTVIGAVAIGVGVMTMLKP